MPYSLGAQHAIAGSGSVGIAAPIGLRIQLANIPASAGRLAGAVPEYYGLGRLVVGNDDGYLPFFALKHASGLWYPLPDSLNVLHYELFSGVTATVTELTSTTSPPSSRPMPWDRNPAFVLQAAGPTQLAGGTPDSQAWTYTVPSNRLFHVARAMCSVGLVAAQTSAGAAYAYIQIAGSISVYADNRGGAQGFTVRDDLVGELILPPGTVCTGRWYNGMSVPVVVSTILGGYLFDL